MRVPFLRNAVVFFAFFACYTSIVVQSESLSIPHSVLILIRASQSSSTTAPRSWEDSEQSSTARTLEMRTRM
jgi:hypothetical protein